MYTFIGIDPGLSPAVAVMRGEKIRFFVLKNTYEPILSWPKFRNDHSKVWVAGLSVTLLLNRIPGRKIIGLEGLAFGKRFNVGLMGMIQFALIENIYKHPHVGHVEVIPPQSVKKIVTGSGRASKEEVRQWLVSHYPNMPSTTNYNCTDALAVLLAAKKLWEESKNQ